MRFPRLLPVALWLALGVGVLGSCGDDPCPTCQDCPAGTGSIFGTVRDMEISVYLPGVTVTAHPGTATAQTGADGMYRLNGLAAGVYMVHFTKSGYRPDSAAVLVAEGGSSLLDRRLLSESDTLTWLGSVTTAGGSYALAVRDQVAWLAGNSGLQAFDVADPAQPVLLGQLSLAAADAGAVVLNGDVAYVAHRTAMIEVVDVATPAAPALVRSVRVGGYAWDAARDGNVLLVAAADSLVVLDVALPDWPLVVARRATVRVNYGGSNRGLVLDTGRKLAFVCSVDGGMEVFDYANPAAPVRVGLQGSSLAPFDAALVPGTMRAVLATYSGLEFVSYAQPSAPQSLGIWSSGIGSDWRDIMLVRSLAIIASPGYGLRVLDIADPGNPRLLEMYRGESWGHPREIASEGDRVYVIGDARLAVFTFPVAPTR